MNVLSVFAKDPHAAPAKTRLARSVGVRHADALARALLTDAIALAADVADASPETTVSVFHTPDTPATRDRLRGLAPTLGHEPQRGTDLGQRMAGCFEGWFARGADRVVIIGTDCPTLTPGDISDAFDALETTDVVISPASDGGYVLLGLSAPRPQLLEGVTWGGDRVLAQTAATARRLSLSLRLLPMHADLDRFEDLRPVFGLLEARLLTLSARGQATYWTLQDLLSRPLMNPPASDVTHFDDIPPADCPCGQARRAWADAADFPATVHRTSVGLDARPHVHRGQTECYVVLDCGPGAALELDGRRIPVTAGSTALIRPGCVHRAVGEMELLIVCTPKFDPADERVIDA